MLKVGITGGIGSGKSTISKMFSLMGIPVYNSDNRSKYLMNNDKKVINALKNKFGEELYIQGDLNRLLLAELIFNNKDAIEFVNDLVHPIVGRDYLDWTQKLPNIPYCLKEAALLFESGLYKELDFIITILCPEKIRINRVMLRDNVSYEKVIERIRNQWSDDEKMKLSDFIIYNNDQNSLIEQMLIIHNKLINHT